MSKAILVIDVEDEFEYRVINKYFTGNIDLYLSNNEIMEYEGVILKPMPTIKIPVFNPNDYDVEEEIKIIHEIEGYNRCVNEIEGGQE